jgi:hypothetical protein
MSVLLEAFKKWNYFLNPNKIRMGTT